MKAVIMAGGEGSRLRPLTCDLPKPMARLCGRPVLEYILELLGGHGVREAAITLRYLPQRVVDHFPDARHAGVRLRFVEESEPLGTAGGVKNAWESGDDDVLVISGDAMCDFDLSSLATWHRRMGADVTIVGKRVQDPREYGLISADEDGRIIGFIEKPAFSQAVSDVANTGIYLLSRAAIDLIPENKMFDFAKDLFPLMLAKGMKLQCWEGDGYWCDIGDLDSYIRCQQDMLLGHVRCMIVGERDSAGNVFAGRVPHTTAGIRPPVYVGRHVRVEESAVIESGSVLDDGCRVESGARVTGSVLLQNSHVGRHARLTGAIVCAAAVVNAGAMLFEGATVGGGATVGEKATVNAGVKIWNNKQVPAGAVADSHVKTSAPSRALFDEDGISGQLGVELTPEFAARVGAAVGSLHPGGRVAVGCSSHRGGAVLKSALCAGIRSTGTDVIDFGENFQAQFAFSMSFCAVSTGVYIRGDSRAAIKVMSTGGLPATRETERGIEGVLSRAEYVRGSGDDMGDLVEMPGMLPLYKSQIARCAPKGLSGCHAKVKSHNLGVQNALRDVLYRLGCDSGGLTLEISAQGDRVRISDPELGYIHHNMIFAWCCLDEMERGEDIAVPFDAPSLLDEMGAALGRRVLRYYNCPADTSDREARALAEGRLWSRDALMQAVMFLSVARRVGGVEALIERTPSFHRAVRTMDTQGNPAALLRGMDPGSGDGGVSEGVLLREDRGTVLVRPLKRGTGLRIYAEAVNAEIADAMCDEIERKLRRRE